MNWVLANLDVVGRHTVSHLVLALPPIVLSLLLAVPLGWLANRVRWLRTPLLTGAGLFYAIPSLPLFVVLPVVIGTGIRDPLNIIIALTLYGLALLVPVAADALRQVDARALDAADAMGYPAASSRSTRGPPAPPCRPACGWWPSARSRWSRWAPCSASPAWGCCSPTASSAASSPRS